MAARPLVSVVLDRSAYIRQENAGEGGARNAGLRVAAGDHVAFLAHHDTGCPRVLPVSSSGPRRLRSYTFTLRALTC